MLDDSEEGGGAHEDEVVQITDRDRGTRLEPEPADRNPVDLLPDAKARPQAYIDTFTDSEVDDVLALGFLDSPLMMILLDAGMRKSEARALQVRRIKLDVRELVVIGGKGGKDRVVPMTGRLHVELSNLLALEHLDSQDHLWYSKPGRGRVRRDQPIGNRSFERWWARCPKTAWVRYRNPHVDRHTFATQWLRRGGRLETLRLALGHASIRATADLHGHLATRDVHADLAMMESL